MTAFVPRFQMRGVQAGGRQFVDVGDLIAALYKSAAHPGQPEDAVAFARALAGHLENPKIEDIPQGKETQS